MVGDKQIRDMETARALDDFRPGNTDQWKETTRPELFKFLARPDMQSKIVMRIDRTEYVPQLDENSGKVLLIPINKQHNLMPLTKELKTSMLDTTQILYVGELGDIALYLNSYGACEFSEFLMAFQQAFLSAAVSKDATFLKLAQSEYNIRQIQMSQQKRRLFSRKERDEQ